MARRGGDRGVDMRDEAYDDFNYSRHDGPLVDVDDIDYDRVSVVSEGVSEWSDGASVRSGYTGLSGVSNANHRYADAKEMLSREAKEQFLHQVEERRGRRTDDDGEDLDSDSSESSPSTSSSSEDGEYSHVRSAQRSRNRSLTMVFLPDDVHDTLVEEGTKYFGRNGQGEDEFHDDMKNFEDSFRGQYCSDTTPIYSSLAEAAASGSLEALTTTTRRLRNIRDKKVNESKFSVNSLDDGKSALHVACELPNDAGLEMLTYVFDTERADVNVIGAMGITPTHVASYCGNVKCLERLLGNTSIQVNSQDDDGSTALHWAASSGKAKACDLLLQNNECDVDILNCKGKVAEQLVGEGDYDTQLVFRDSNIRMEPHNLASDGRVDLLRRILSVGHGVEKLDPETSHHARRMWKRLGRVGALVSVGQKSTATDHNSTTADQKPIEPPITKTVHRKPRAGIAIDTADATKDGETMCHRSARFCRVETFKMLLLDFGADVDKRCTFGTTPLHIACENGSYELLPVFKQISAFPRICKRRAEAKTTKRRRDKQSANVKVSNEVIPNSATYSPPGSTPLHFAARNGHTKCVEFLIQHMLCSINVTDDDGMTATHVAAAYGQLDVLQKLKENGADMDAIDSDGRTPCHLAAHHGRYETVAFLINSDTNGKKRLMDRDQRGNAPAHLASQQGHTECALLLLPKSSGESNESKLSKMSGSNFRGEGGWTCLHFATYGGHLELVERIITLNSTSLHLTDAVGATALHVAAERGVVAVVEALLATAAEQSDRGQENMNEGNASPTSKHLQGAVQLVTTKTNDGRTALHVASRHGNVATASVLLAMAPGTLNSLDDDDSTPLHKACWHGDRNGTRVAKLLLQAGASLNIRTKADHADVLHVAASINAVDTVTALLNYASALRVTATLLNRRTKGGLTPLACAARAGAVQCFELLLKFGADPFVPDNRENTCAHHACARRASGEFFGNPNAFIGDASKADEGIDETSSTEFQRGKNAKDVFVSVLRFAVRKAKRDLELTMDVIGGGVMKCVTSRVTDGARKTHSNTHGMTKQSEQVLGAEYFRIINSTNDDGETCAHVAARSGHVSLLKFLLDRGAGILTKDKRGRDVLQAACEKDRPVLTGYLVSYVREYGEEQNVFDEGINSIGVRVRGPRNWADGVPLSSVRWRVLKRSISDVVAVTRENESERNADLNISEDRLLTAALTRLGVDALLEDWNSNHENSSDDDDDEYALLKGLNDDTETKLSTMSKQSKRRSAFHKIDAALKAADELFKLKRMNRFVNKKSNTTGDAPLHVAAQYANPHVCRVLLNAGSDINLRDEADTGDAPLHRLMKSINYFSGKIDAVLEAVTVFLKDTSVDLCAKNSEWVTPLHQAVRFGDVTLVGALLRHAEVVESKHVFSFGKEHKKDKGSVAELVNRARRSGATPLHSAAELGHFEVFNALLHFGADYDARTIRNESVAHYAAKLGNADVLRRLLQWRYEKRMRKEKNEDEDENSIEDFLVARDHTESFPLHWAAAGGHYESCKVLIAAGSPVNIGGMWRGASPAHLAARSGSGETLALLLENGADVNSQDFWTMATPLHYASEAGQVDTVRVLLEKHARVDVVDTGGVTPERVARDVSIAKTIFATRIIGVVGRRLAGVKFSDIFYAWRHTAGDSRSLRARDAKSTWQLVFALFDDDGGGDDNDSNQKSKKTNVSKYYWLWRQWETRRRRRRRLLCGAGELGRVQNVVADALESNSASSGLRHAALLHLAESWTMDEGMQIIEKGKEIWKEGDASDGTMRVLINGRLDVFMTHEDSYGVACESKVATLKPGTTFGEHALRFEGPRPTTIRARRESMLVTLKRDAFEKSWAMERESVLNETTASRARRATNRRRRRAERKLRKDKRLRYEQKRLESVGGWGGGDRKNNDKKLNDSSSESEYNSDPDDAFRTSIDPTVLSNFSLPTSLVGPNREETGTGRVSKNSDGGKSLGSSSRNLHAWEMEFLATLLTVVKFDPGSDLPVAGEVDDPDTGDPIRTAVEDSFFAFILQGEVIVTTKFGFGERGKTKVDILKKGETYFSLAARAKRNTRVLKYGADSVRVSSSATEPCVVALLQGLDIAELPRSLRDLLLRRSQVHSRWVPPPRIIPRSTAELDSESEVSDSSEDELGDWEDDKDDPCDGDAAADDDDPDAELPYDSRGIFHELVLELIEAFHHVDTDKGGDIDEGELKFAARSLGFEPDPTRLQNMLQAMDEDGGGSIDLGEFITTTCKRIIDSVDPDSLDVAFDLFDKRRKGRIVLKDIQAVARQAGDTVTTDELKKLVNLGAADLDGDGEIDRGEFGEIMRVKEVDVSVRRASLRKEIKRQKIASEDASIVAEMLGEYVANVQLDANTTVIPNAFSIGLLVNSAQELEKKHVAYSSKMTPLRVTLKALFDAIAQTDDKHKSSTEISVHALLDSLRKDAAADGSLAKALNLPLRITNGGVRRDDGSAEKFEILWREMDVDNSRAVDFDEFFSYFRKLKSERAAEIVARAVSRYEELAGKDGGDMDSDDEEASKTKVLLLSSELVPEDHETTVSKNWIAGQTAEQLAFAFRAKAAFLRNKR